MVNWMQMPKVNWVECTAEYPYQASQADVISKINKSRSNLPITHNDILLCR